MPYLNVLTRQTKEYNEVLKIVRKLYPSYSIADKHSMALGLMLQNRGLAGMKLTDLLAMPYTKEFQYASEVVMVNEDMNGGLPRYYIKDDNLFDFFKNTPVNVKDVQSILDVMNDEYQKTHLNLWGVIGQTYSFSFMYVKVAGDDRHFVNVFTEDMNYTFCVEDYDEKVNEQKWVFNMVVNFLFYIHAFPECVVDGVPNSVKRNPNAKTISVSEKVVSHNSTEHGFVRPHFRSGYFRHLNSDYFVNCKGQVRFIQSTMVKGRAKTVLPKEEN